ncbi:hypothetical protein AGMMS49992_20130 [Clostridia bacterium]|nr:hypothetical protein AGMMS49992_20130 [Clostridia bacterium]
MKRELLENVKVIPYTAGAVVDKLNFLSAVLGMTVSAASTITVAATHCDTATGTFTAITDTQFVVGPKSITLVAADVPANLNIPLDLVGCKRYIKITPSGGTGLALVLGDPEYMPVK